MKALNPSGAPLVTIKRLYKASMLIAFVWLAGCAFQAQEHLVGCISLIMAMLTPKFENFGGVGQD